MGYFSHFDCCFFFLFFFFFFLILLLACQESFPGTEEAFLPSGELIYGNTNDAFNKQEFARGQSGTECLSFRF